MAGRGGATRRTRFAILGLRALNFLLAGVIHKFHYLKLGLSVVLVFVGAKMLFGGCGRRVAAVAEGRGGVRPGGRLRVHHVEQRAHHLVALRWFSLALSAWLREREAEALAYPLEENRTSFHRRTREHHTESETHRR